MASKFSFISSDNSVVDPDLRGVGGKGKPGFLSLALPAFLPSVILFFYPGGGGCKGGPGPLPLIYHCNPIMFKAIGKKLNPRSYQSMISKYYPPNR